LYSLARRENVEIPQHWPAFIEDQLRSRRFNTPGEATAAGLRLLEAQTSRGADPSQKAISPERNGLGNGLALIVTLCMTGLVQRDFSGGRTQRPHQT
jgi:Arc/MetJ-type ribon-helix-helix transcriptional regulator